MANPFISQGMDMQNPEAVQIMRRQKMAEQLLSQGQEPLQGQMVSGHYVAPSWTQQLAKGLNTYMGYKGLKESDEAQKALAETLRGKRQEDLSKFAELLGGRPEGNAPVDGVGPVQPAQAPNPGEAYKYAMGSQTPELQQLGMQGLAQMPIMAAQKAEREDARAFRQQEAEANRAARMDELKLRMEDGQRSQQERLQAQKELREMQIQAQKDMQRMIASNRPSPQAQIIQTDSGPMQLQGGKAMPIIGPDGKPVSAPKKGAAGLSATAQKELFEADDAVQNGLGAVSSLQKALDLNNKAYSGVGAATRATIMSNLGQSDGADATIAMDNIIKDQALTSMKSIFGGNPTEGERAILLDLQASASKTPKQREEILGRAMQAAKRRTEFNKQKADALRGGSYMSEGGAPQVPVQGKRVKFDAQGNIVP